MPLMNQEVSPSDLIDLVPAPVITKGASTSFDPNVQPPSDGHSTAAKLADIYALYSEAGRTQPCISGQNAPSFSQLAPVVSHMPYAAAHAPQQPTQSGLAGGMSFGP